MTLTPYLTLSMKESLFLLKEMGEGGKGGEESRLLVASASSGDRNSLCFHSYINPFTFSTDK